MTSPGAVRFRPCAVSSAVKRQFMPTAMAPIRAQASSTSIYPMQLRDISATRSPRPTPAADQDVREPVHPCVQLRVGQAALALDQRGSLAVQRGGGREQPPHRRRRGPPRPRAAGRNAPISSFVSLRFRKRARPFRPTHPPPAPPARREGGRMGRSRRRTTLPLPRWGRGPGRGGPPKRTPLLMLPPAPARGPGCPIPGGS